jgi:hypothetical protein
VLAIICTPSIDHYSATCWFPGPSEQLKGRWRRWPRGNSGSRDWPLLSRMHQVKFNDKSVWDEFHTLVFISFFKALQRDCSVDNVTRWQVRSSGVRLSSGNIHTFSCSKCLETYQPPIVWAVGIHSIIRIKQPASKFDRLTPSIVEFKNEWSSAYTSLKCLEKIDLDNFAFALPFSWQNVK